MVRIENERDYKTICEHLMVRMREQRLIFSAMGGGRIKFFFIGDFTDSRAIKMTYILLRFVMQESVPAGLGRNPLLRAALRQK